MYNLCGKCNKPLTPNGQHRRGGPTDHPAFRRWDGKQPPGSWERNTGRLLLGRGFLPKVLADFTVTSVDGLEIPPEIPIVSVDSLRDFQQEALKTIFTRRWGRIALPTNAGKGAIIALAAHSLSLAQRRTLILCDEVAVFQALQQEIEKWSGQKPALIQAGVKVAPVGAVVLAMVPTLVRRTEEWPDWFKSIDAVLLDEADKASAKTWQTILDALPNTHIRVGFSGTFIDGEVTVAEMTLHESVGPVLMRLRNADLIARKISARPYVELVPYEHYLDLPRDWDDMDGPAKKQFIFSQGIVLNEHRHQMIAGLLDPNEPNAIIVNYIEHGRQLESVIPNSAFLHGSDSPEVRSEVLSRYRKGDVQNLIVTKILDRGTNELGKVVGLVLASGEGSDRQNLQRIGRGLRRADGKEFLFLRDVIDRGHKYFETASTKRVQLYNNEGFEISIRTLVQTSRAGLGIYVEGI